MGARLKFPPEMQEYMVREPGVMPRRAYTKLAQQARCQLYCPFPNDSVVLLRTGVLLHIKRYMQVRYLSPALHGDMPLSPFPNTWAVHVLFLVLVSWTACSQILGSCDAHVICLGWSNGDTMVVGSGLAQVKNEPAGCQKNIPSTHNIVRCVKICVNWDGLTVSLAWDFLSLRMMG